MSYTVALLSADFSSSDRSFLHDYETREIIHELKKTDATVHVVDPQNTTYGIVGGKGYSLARSIDGDLLKATALDAIFVRRTRALANRISEYCMYCQKEESMIFISDPIDSLINSISKSYSTARRIGKTSQPETLFFSKISDLPTELKFPLVYKPVFGRAGVGVALCKNKDDIASSMKNQTEFHGDLHMIQEYIDIKREFRVSVIGGKVIGIVEKPAPENGIARNSTFVGEFKKYEGDLKDDLEKQAVYATRAMGYDVCGVDLIEGSDAIYTLECNRSPQFQAFDRAYGGDAGSSLFAKKVASFILNRDRFY
jgi:glutathione synthase/RimK-type ligase-like ATP-grasp enzyme